ncbi:hypothetical protein NMY22_g15856 [Coprinellus aureogranulatus]|nr:hypothetical protein NMY22_g15856 [Coprinellus aureogranulatus]
MATMKVRLPSLSSGFWAFSRLFIDFSDPTPSPIPYFGFHASRQPLSPFYPELGALGSPSWTPRRFFFCRRSPWCTWVRVYLRPFTVSLSVIRRFGVPYTFFHGFRPLTLSVDFVCRALFQVVLRGRRYRANLPFYGHLLQFALFSFIYPSFTPSLLSPAPLHPLSPLTNPPPLLPAANQGDAGSSPENVRVKDWRHKLQKTFLGKVPPKDEDMPDIDALFKTVEGTEVGIEGLQYSKIGKVMRHIAALAPSKVPRDAEFKFRERAKALVERWQGVLNAAKVPTNGTPVTAAAGSPGKEEREDPDAKAAKDTAAAIAAATSGGGDVKTFEGESTVGAVKTSESQNVKSLGGEVDMDAPGEKDAQGEKDADAHGEADVDAPGEVEGDVVKGVEEGTAKIDLNGIQAAEAHPPATSDASASPFRGWDSISITTQTRTQTLAPLLLGLPSAEKDEWIWGDVYTLGFSTSVWTRYLSTIQWFQFRSPIASSISSVSESPFLTSFHLDYPTCTRTSSSTQAVVLVHRVVFGPPGDCRPCVRVKVS